MQADVAVDLTCLLGLHPEADPSQLLRYEADESVGRLVVIRNCSEVVDMYVDRGLAFVDFYAVVERNDEVQQEQLMAALPQLEYHGEHDSRCQAPIA